MSALPLPAIALALLQQVPAPEAVEGDRLLTGYIVVAAGVLDLLLALFFTALRPLPDPKVRTVVGGAMAFGGIAMIVVGVLLIFGTFGG